MGRPANAPACLCQYPACAFVCIALGVIFNAFVFIAFVFMALALYVVALAIYVENIALVRLAETGRCLPRAPPTALSVSPSLITIDIASVIVHVWSVCSMLGVCVVL